MIKRFISSYPKYTVHSKQYQKKPKWGDVCKNDTSLDSVEPMKSNYVNKHLRGYLGRQNEYISKIPPPYVINECIDSRDDYEQNKPVKQDISIWKDWKH